MKNKKPAVAGFLSLLVPGLGQMAAGQGTRGALILLAVIVVGNLNVIWLSLYAGSLSSQTTFWPPTLPRFLHDLFAVYGVVFWIWQVVDAIRLAKVNDENSSP